jgi:hypothetical protein
MMSNLIHTLKNRRMESPARCPVLVFPGKYTSNSNEMSTINLKHIFEKKDRKAFYKIFP